MDELKLNFFKNGNPTLIVLDEDGLKEALKVAKDLSLSATTFAELLKKGTLESGFCQTLLSLFESYTVNMHNRFNYESTLKKQHEDRYIEIRSLHIQNNELRSQLGNKVSSEDVREKLKNLKTTIDEWWQSEGLGYVSETAFYPYVCRIKLSGSMSFHYDKKQPAYLRSKGYNLVEPEKERFELAHSEKNITLLTSEVIKRFPSAKLSNIELSNYQILHIKDAEFVIHNYDDIK